MIRKASVIIATTAISCSPITLAQWDSDTLLIETESEEIFLIDEPEEQEFIPESDTSGDELVIEGANEPNSIDFNKGSEETVATHDKPELFRVDKLRAEVAHLGDSNARGENLGYIHGLASFNWNSGQWEAKISARLDAYSQNGENDYDNANLDYDESYLRYRSDNSALTIGAQKIIWGRIDEFPPTDRLSTQDIRRMATDDLEDRRLASPAIRYEHFFGDSKIDLVAYPEFREAQLPDRESVWHPVNRETGEVLGLKTNSLMQALIKTTPVKENAPDSEGGLAARFTSLGPTGDYGLTIQRGRSTLPYFAYNPASNTIEGRYPRNWMISGDIAFEALGGTLKLEGSWFSDTPVTRRNGSYDTMESINWGIALELYPGDGDARLNLQLVAQNLLGSIDTIDRHEIYNFNGTFETPFGDNNWRAKMRFNFGLDEKDIYLNPEIAYTGLEAQEIYLELHYLDGDSGTPGGYYQDNSLAALGWRADL